MTSESRWLNWLNERPRLQVWLGVGTAVVLLAAGLYLLRFNPDNFWMRKLFAFWLAATALMAGSVGLARKTAGSTLPDLHATRLYVVSQGALIGFGVWGLAWLLLLYPPTAPEVNPWWRSLVGGLPAWQGDDWWRLWVILLLQLGGLSLMLVSLLIGLPLVRTYAWVRRSLYGYNAILGLLLLSANLLLINILVSIYVPAVADWTETGLHSLSPKSQAILQNLQQPVKVYVLQVSSGDRASREAKQLLDSCQRVTDKLKVEYLTRDRDRERINELIKQYQLLQPVGILVVYGGGDGQDSHEFLNFEDMFEFTQQGGELFKGESNFIGAVNLLVEGKVRPILYFTQGNRELDIEQSGRTGLDEGAGALRKRLEQGNYVVKGLVLSKSPLEMKNKNIVVAPRVPEDAAVVVVAAPRTPFSPDALEALQLFLEPKEPAAKKGKLIALVDLSLNADGDAVETGLERLLGEYNVQLPPERLMSVSNDPPNVVDVEFNEEVEHPIVSAFGRALFKLFDARPVLPRERPAQGREMFQPVPLMLASKVFAEKDLRTSPAQLMANLGKLSPAELRARIKLFNFLPVGVAISESPNPLTNPHGGGKHTPRLVVIGDASFISNQLLDSPSGSFYYSLFSSNVVWLREKSEEGGLGLEPKQRHLYSMDQRTNVLRMLFAPFLLMFLGVLGLGMGIWITRRR